MRADERRRKILEILAETYPDAKCELNYTTPFELLVATILSAQSTDKRVNMVTERLFARYNTPEAFAALPYENLEEEIREIGLYRSKARNIIEMSRRLLEEFDGEVPRDREALEKLPGVGRKTANVVLSNAFGVPAIAVDTHVFRVANRLGLAEGAKTPLETEKQLMQNIPRELWSKAHHWLIHHGRRICHARNPRCGECPLLSLCPEGAERTRAARRPQQERADAIGRDGAAQRAAGAKRRRAAAGAAAPAPERSEAVTNGAPRAARGRRTPGV